MAQPDGFGGTKVRGLWVALTVALAATAAVVTVPSVPAFAIAHGVAAAEGAYPFAVKITDLDIPVAGGGDRDSSCSAGLISPHWILTAGHCFRDAGGRRVSRVVARRSIATVGRTDLTTHDGRQADIVAVRQSGVADVALAELDHAITGIAPLKLSRKAPRAGSVVRLAGYGQTSTANTELPQHLQTGKFRVSSVTRAEIGMTGTSPRADTSPCKHDSGGPYFTQAANGTSTVVAVVSHGPDCPHYGADSAGRIDNIASWIQGIIGKDVVAPPKPSKPSGGPASAAPGSAIAAPPAPPAGPVPAASLDWLLPAAGLFAAGGIAVGGFTLAHARARRRPRSRHRRRG